MIQGTPKFDALVIAKIEVDFLKNPIHIDVQAAFINNNTGDTHGWTRGSPGWSEQTRELIAKLRDSMESDLAVLHFGTGKTATATTSNGQTAVQSVGGLGEHLGSGDGMGVPSV